MMRKVFAAAMLAVAGLLAVPAFGAVVETVNIDTYEPGSDEYPVGDGDAGPYYTTTTLSAGQPYLITISGTFSVWLPLRWSDGGAGTPEESPIYPSSGTTNTGLVSHDPEYQFACPLFYDWCSVETFNRRHHSGLQISLDGGTSFTHMEPINGEYNAATHSYQYLVVGQGAAAAFRFLDGNTTDNYGMLIATVETTDAGAFATGGGTVIDENGGEANFGLAGRDQKGKVQGSLEYQNHAGTNVHADSLTAVYAWNTGTAYIAGNASVNGEPGHTFMLTVQDNGEPGAGSDTFRLDLDGSTVASGTLSGGNIQVHAK